jgi:hypothetical protein
MQHGDGHMTTAFVTGGSGFVATADTQIPRLISVATVVATRMEFLGLNGHPWNTWKAKIAG